MTHFLKIENFKKLPQKFTLQIKIFLIVKIVLNKLNKLCVDPIKFLKFNDNSWVIKRNKELGLYDMLLTCILVTLNPL